MIFCVLSTGKTNTSSIKKLSTAISTTDSALHPLLQSVKDHITTGTPVHPFPQQHHVAVIISRLPL